MPGDVDRPAPPLVGVRVVELAGIGPGPYACMLLADLGASVLRFERPGGIDAVRRDPVTTRGRAETRFVDLKQADGVAEVLAAVAAADVLVEGFRPGVMERLGLGPADCAARNPALVYGRMTGWGQTGPLARSAGHDINYIALAGVLHAIGPRHGKPVLPLNLVGDFGGGAMFLVVGVLAALLQARVSGRGSVVDAAMVDGAGSLMAMILGRVASGHWLDGQRASNSLDGGVPWYDTYETADGKYLALGANERPFYDLMCGTLGLAPHEAGWRDDPARWPELARCIGERVASRTRDEWAAAFAGSDACVSPVLTLAEAAQHPHNVARASFVAPGGVLQPAAAPRFSPLPPKAADQARR